MNLYRVISETLWETIPVLDFGQGPEEPYAIAELIAAESRGKAKWLAWKSDKSFDGNIRDMPRFSAVCVAKDVQIEAGIHSDVPEFQCHWINGAEIEETTGSISK